MTDADIDLNDRLISDLTCPSCAKWMVPPIYLCLNGHSVCNVCVTKLTCPICDENLTKTHNLIVEQIIETTLNYPCKNKEFGCNTKRSIHELEDHLTCCRYRDYNCKLDELCKWTGKRNAMLEHCISKHSKTFLGNPAKITWTDTNPEHEVHIINAFNEIFFIHSLIKDNLIYWIGYCLGDSNDEIRYSYQIELVDTTALCCKTTFRQTCFRDYKDNVNEMLEPGFCVAMPLTHFQCYENGKNKIIYKIIIIINLN